MQSSNVLKPGYMQPIFNDELPSTISTDDATLVSQILTDAIKAGYTSGFYKNYIVRALDRVGLNPMFVVVQESPNGGHVLYELDINGVGTGVYLQLISTLGIYNVFLIPIKDSN